MNEIRITIAGSGPWRVMLDSGEALCPAASQPFGEGARALVARGHDPGAMLVMRRRGEAFDAMRGRLGEAAKLMVAANTSRTPVFRKYRAKVSAGVPSQAV